MSKKMVDKKTRKIIFELYNGKCALCGRELHMDINKSQENNYIQIDHITPRSQGGGNEIKNLRAVCRSCNSIRGCYSGEKLKERVMKPFIEANLLIQENNYNRLMDDIKNGFITKEDVKDIYIVFKECMNDNLKVFKELVDAIELKEVE